MWKFVSVGRVILADPIRADDRHLGRSDLGLSAMGRSEDHICAECGDLGLSEGPCYSDLGGRQSDRLLEQVAMCLYLCGAVGAHL